MNDDRISTEDFEAAAAEREAQAKAAKEEKESELYSVQDVAKIFGVDAKTIARWSTNGEFQKRNVQILSTIGGHRRFYREEIHQLYNLMLEGKLYSEDERGNIDETASPSRIAGLPKAPTGNV